MLGVVLACSTALGARCPGTWQEGFRSWVFLFPALFLAAIGLLVPAIRTIYLSLFDDDCKKFVGIDNYTEIFTGRNTRLTVFNSFLWVVVGTALTVIVGLPIARFAEGMRAEKVAKSAIFIPAAISLVGAGVIWGFVYAGPPFKIGLLNRVTTLVPGLPTSMGGDGERIWLVERGFGALNPPDGSPGSTPSC